MIRWHQTDACRLKLVCGQCRFDRKFRESVRSLGMVAEADFECDKGLPWPTPSEQEAWDAARAPKPQPPAPKSVGFGLELL